MRKMSLRGIIMEMKYGDVIHLDGGASLGWWSRNNGRKI